MFLCIEINEIIESWRILIDLHRSFYILLGWHLQCILLRTDVYLSIWWIDIIIFLSPDETNNLTVSIYWRDFTVGEVYKNRKQLTNQAFHLSRHSINKTYNGYTCLHIIFLSSYILLYTKWYKSITHHHISVKVFTCRKQNKHQWSLRSLEL